MIIQAAAKEALRAMGLVASAYLLAYALVAVLPDASYAAFGIFSSNEAVVSAWRNTQAHDGLGDRAARLTHLDFGRTLDGVPVLDQLSTALLVSAPHLVIGAMFIMVVVVGVGYRGYPGGKFEQIVSFSNFLPQYVLVVAIALSAATLNNAPGFQGILAGLALGIAPASLMAAQAYQITAVNLRSEHVRFHRACGASEHEVRRRLFKNLLFGLLPSFQNALLALIGSLLFVEIALGIGGLGALTARAIRRTDVDLVLGLVVFYAFSTSLIQGFSRMVRAVFPE